MKPVILTALITAVVMSLVLASWSYAQHVKVYSQPHVCSTSK